MARNLIIYYSRTGENYVRGKVKNLAKGNTEIVAEYIQKAAGGDLFQVETVKEYAADYYECIKEAKAELRAKARPELKNYLTDISDYDNIIVAGPCWWGTYPMGVLTQIEKLDFTGKKVQRSCRLKVGSQEILQGSKAGKRSCCPRSECRKVRRKGSQMGGKSSERLRRN